MSVFLEIPDQNVLYSGESFFLIYGKYKFSINIFGGLYAIFVRWHRWHLNAQNFAILRPKENETSVILDFQKRPGELSQTLLIPSDLEKSVKDRVADIIEPLTFK